jgi:hypothetical protein
LSAAAALLGAPNTPNALANSNPTAMRDTMGRRKSFIRGAPFGRASALNAIAAFMGPSGGAAADFPAITFDPF